MELGIVLLLSIFSTSFVDSIKSFFKFNDFSFKVLQILSGIFISYMTFIKAKKIEHSIKVYPEMVKVLEDSHQGISMRFFDVESYYNIDLKLTKSGTPEDFKQKLDASIKKFWDKIQPSALQVAFLYENYEFILRPQLKTYLEVLNILNRMQKLIRKIQIKGYDIVFDFNNDKKWQYFMNYVEVYNMKITDLGCLTLDLRIFLSNHIFGNIYNIFIPMRKPLVRKHKAFKPNYWESKSFMDYSYDWISRFFWWV